MPEFKEYIRKPFLIRAVEVTKDNIDGLAEEIGDGRVRTKDNGDLYFFTDRKLVRSVPEVKLGYLVSKMDDQWRVYLPEVFEKLFSPISSGLGRALVIMLAMDEEIQADAV